MNLLSKYYISLFFRPYKNLFGFLAVFLLILVFTISIILIYIYSFYNNKMVEQIRGIYPNIFWKGRLDPSDKPENVILNPEVFLMKKVIKCSPRKEQRMMEVVTGVRAADLEILKFYYKFMNNSSKNDIEPVWLSERLYQAIFSIDEDNKKKLFLKTWDGRWEEVDIIGKPLSLETGEKWIIMSMGLWQKIDDATDGQPNIVSIYFKDDSKIINKMKINKIPKRLRDKYKILTWEKRAPFYYKIFVTLINSGIKFFLVILILLVFIYITALILMFFIEHTTGVNLIRLFGCRKVQLFTFLFLSISIVGIITIGLAFLFATGLIALKSLYFDFMPYLKISSFLNISSWLSNDIFYVFVGMLIFTIVATYLVLKGIFQCQPAKLLDN